MLFAFPFLVVKEIPWEKLDLALQSELKWHKIQAVFSKKENQSSLAKRTSFVPCSNHVHPALLVPFYEGKTFLNAWCAHDFPSPTKSKSQYPNATQYNSVIALAQEDVCNIEKPLCKK